MKKILLFIPWYGQLPNYFNTWLQSAMKLEGLIDFLLVGDFEKISASGGKIFSVIIFRLQP